MGVYLCIVIVMVVEYTKSLTAAIKILFSLDLKKKKTRQFPVIVICYEISTLETYSISAEEVSSHKIFYRLCRAKKVCFRHDPKN